jgi:hypothetical protein
LIHRHKRVIGSNQRLPGFGGAAISYWTGERSMGVGNKTPDSVINTVTSPAFGPVGRLTGWPGVVGLLLLSNTAIRSACSNCSGTTHTARARSAHPADDFIIRVSFHQSGLTTRNYLATGYARNRRKSVQEVETAVRF